jgi:hypothetical protein
MRIGDGEVDCVAVVVSWRAMVNYVSGRCGIEEFSSFGEVRFGY